MTADIGADDGVVISYGDEGVAALVLGRGSRLRRGTILYAGSRIGDCFSTGHNVVVRERCEIGEGVSIWSNTVVDYGCMIGDRVKIHSNCYIAQYSVLEADVFLAPGVSFANDLIPGDRRSAELMQGPTVRVGAQLGVNVTVLPYVEIGAGAIVGAGSVVTKDVAAGTVVVGNPARPIGNVSAIRPVEERLDIRGDSRRVMSATHRRHG